MGFSRVSFGFSLVYLGFIWVLWGTYHFKYICITVIYLQINVSDDIFFYLIVLMKNQQNDNNPTLCSKWKYR